MIPFCDVIGSNSLCSTFLREVLEPAWSQSGRNMMIAFGIHGGLESFVGEPTAFARVAEWRGFDCVEIVTIVSEAKLLGDKVGTQKCR